VESLLESVDDGRRTLRLASLGQLEDSDPMMVDRALASLFFLAEKEDLPRIVQLKSHPSPMVVKAAAWCEFELRSRW